MFELRSVGRRGKRSGVTMEVGPPDDRIEMAKSLILRPRLEDLKRRYLDRSSPLDERLQ